jgi:hypothetical protein
VVVLLLFALDNHTISYGLATVKCDYLMIACKPMMIDTSAPSDIMMIDTYARVLLSRMVLYLDQRREHETILDIIRR